MRKYTMALTVASMVFFGINVQAGDAGKEYSITIKDHIFTPGTLKVAAGQKVKLVIDNQDKTPEEFESYELNREKIIKGNSKAVVFIGPLKPGSYAYFGDFNKDTAKGSIIAE